MGGFVPFHAFEASAGSGKTFNLVVRYLSLLFMGEDAEKILALTFTNKAANEMQERIIETLKTLPQRGELAVISGVTGMSEESLLAQRKAVLARFLNADAKVMTIDRFFAKILRKFSLHAGLMPNFSTFESQHELKVTARFLTLAEVEGKEASLIDLSLLASKRLSDIFGLLSELYAKSKELKSLTFSKEAYAPYAEEAMDAAKALREMIGASGVSARGKAAMEAEDIDALMAKSWVTRETLQYWDYKKYFEPEMDLLLFRIQRALRSYMQAKEGHFLSGLFSLLETYVEAKNRVAREEGELSFDDITALVFYLLKERIDSEFLYFRLDSRISHLLLDEFQDTSIVQFEILRPLIEEMVAGKGVDEKGSLFLVGDVKQSIYRFRGGTKELFYAVASAFDVQVDKLVTNYRSDQNVVAFVNDVFADRIKGYVPQEVKPDAAEGYVEVVDDDDVLETMRKTIETLLTQGANPNEIAVLTATNADGAAVEELLKGAGIEVVTETTSKLINQKNVRALIEYLKYSYFNEAIYARNFFALIGAEPSRLKRCDLNAPDLPMQIKQVIETYHLYDGDLNLLRFLEQLSGYKDIEAFLFEYERLDATAAKADLNGVRVLTVHKSKGLEFEHVIVLDRLGRPSADRSPIIYEYDGVRLQNIYLRMKNRDALDPAYAKALEKEKQLASEDALNALYVAFTRAEKSLFVIRKSKGSKFELLDLVQQSRGTLQIEQKESAPQSPPAVLPYKPLFYGTQSDLLASEEPEALDHHAIQFGLALHYTLEMMERFDNESLGIAIESSQNRFGAVLEEGDFASIRKRVEALTADPKFCALSEGRVHREKPVAYKGELRYIDALIEKEGCWVVLDYKSALDHSDKHLQQVRFYKKAVAAITGEAVEGWLCYLLEEGVRLVEV